MKQERLLNELFKFIRLIPEEILSECVGQVTLRTREERRKYEKIRSLDGKIKFLIKNARTDFIGNIYSKFEEDQTGEGQAGEDQAGEDQDTYEDVMRSINADNCISKILYILHFCYGEKFDRQCFEDFIQSAPFQKTIKNEWRNSQFEEELDDIMPQKILEEDKMVSYLGYIESRLTYYNFRPLFEYDEKSNMILDTTSEKFKEIFPQNGFLNLAYEKRTGSCEFLKELNVYKIMDAKFCAGLYVARLDENELEDNENDQIQKKLNLQSLLGKNEDLRKRVVPAAEFKIFKIVHPQENINDEAFTGTILVKENNYVPDEEVLLEYENKLFGPYKLQERSIDGEKYVRPNSGSLGYILDAFEKDAYEIFSFNKNSYAQDKYIYIAHIKKPSRHCDVMSDAVLLTKLTDSIDMDLLTNDPEEFERLYSTTPFFGEVPDEIRERRINRVKEIFQNIADYDDIMKKALNSFVDNLGDKIFDLLGDKIKNSKLYMELQADVGELQKEIEGLNNKNEDLEKEKNQLQFQISQMEEQSIPLGHGLVKADNVEFEALEKENIELKNRMACVDNYESLSDKYAELEKEYDRKTKIYDQKVSEINDKNKELEDIKSKVQQFISNELNKTDATKMLKTAFDPYISNAMIEAASSYRADAESGCYEMIKGEMDGLECDRMDKNALIDMLVEGVQTFRKYSRNEIINIYICLMQNFLTVFSGEPGTGKTSICNIIADSLGLNKFGYSSSFSKNRYVPVSVERGWSSKRDLIGYYNPLTKKYDRSNAKIYDGLMILNEERENSRFPYIILLDEANLSPMEYYWSDFMRVTDREDGDIYINIGLEKDIYIPKTLRFLATVNNDQTTEQLSPRLIDRAWLVKLPKTSMMETAASLDDCFKQVVLWSDLEKAFVFPEAKEMSMKNLMEQIYKLFDEHHLSVSHRVQQSIKKYICVAQEIMEDEIGVCNKKEKALDFAIIQKLLPKINGYYKDYERLFASLTQICDENHLKMTKEALILMEEFQRQNMGYCQYLI